MTEREALKLALEALEDSEDQLAKPYSTDVRRAITAIKEALAQPEQEPVAVVNGAYANRIEWKCTPKFFPADGTNLYTTPPQRTWVGLTDEDKQIAFDSTQEGGGFWEFADAIEAKLKEKNT